SAPSVTLTQPTCATPTGTIAFTAQAGVQYGVNGTYQAGTSFASLAPGNYSISVRNSSDNTCITNGTAQNINPSPACAPIAFNDSGNGNEDQPLVLPSVQSNDVDSNGIVVTNTIDLDPSTSGIQTTFTSGNGSWSVNPANGDVTFTPNLNFNGTETIIYTVQDNSGLTSNTANLTAVINPINDAPVVDNETHVINEDGSASGDLTNAGDSDVDGSLVVNTTPLSGPANGTITINPNGTYTYTPNANFNGNDQVIVQICDDGTPLPAICVNDTIFITVNPVNDPPIADNENIAMNEDGSFTGDLTDVGDFDPDSTNLVCAPTPGFGPFHGTIAINSNGTYTYTPNANYFGNDTVVVEVCDQGLPLPGLCTYDTIFITINPINDAPVATIDFTSTFEGIPVSLSVLSNDTDIDGIINTASGTVVQNGSNGTAVISNGTITYTPNAGFVGQDTLIYQVCDNGVPVLCDTAMV
ncbi:MAG: tandem-95 repeat protein, partial [Flavobacteriia bacterium]|nr:tandem-95 repeat protein [Flavobacteriia bacterium]